MSKVIIQDADYTDEEIDEVLRVLGGYAGACDSLGQYVEATHIYNGMCIITFLQYKIAMLTENNQKLHDAYVRLSP